MTKVLILEQAADLPAGSSVDHHLVRPGEALQARRKVRRLTDRRLLAGITRADWLAYDHESRCDADADLEQFATLGCSR